MGSQFKKALRGVYLGGLILARPQQRWLKPFSKFVACRIIAAIFLLFQQIIS
jgi:hypothetical protein